MLKKLLIRIITFTYFVLPWYPLVDYGFTSLLTILMFIIVFFGVLYFILNKNIVIDYRFTLITFTLVILYILGIVWSTSSIYSLLNSAIPFVILFSTLLIIYSASDSQGITVQFLSAYLLGTSILIIGIIVAILSDPTVGSQYTPYNLTPETLDNRLITNNRAGLGMVLGIPISWFLNKRIDNDGTNAIFFYIRYYSILAIPAIILTGSRQSFVAMVSCIIIICSYEFLIKGTISLNIGNTLITLLTTIFGLIVVYVFSGESFDRIKTTYTDLRYMEGNVETRIEILTQGYYLYLERPVLGHGPGMFDELLDTTGVNSTPIIILVEFGIVGFAIFMIFGFVILSYISRFQNEERILWICVIVIWLLIGLLRPIARHPFPYLILILMMVHNRSCVHS